MAGVEVLYKNFGVLADAGENAGDFPDAYQSFIDATKATLPEKKLACQFIPRFLKYFPTIADTAIDAHLDLCEENETSLRCQAIKSLGDFCKDNLDHVNRICDALTQLLQQEDTTELEIVQHSLEVLIEKDPPAALNAMLVQMMNGNELVREKAIDFLSHLVAYGHVFRNCEAAGPALLEEVRKVIGDVTRDEFMTFVYILSNIKSVASDPQNLADLITEEAGLEDEFQPTEPETLDRLITCTRQAVPFFLKGASPAKYLEYMFKNVLPVFSDIVTTEEVDYKYSVLKLVAELSVHATPEVAKEQIEVVFNKILEFVPPLSPEEIDEEIVNKLNFSFVECLLYALHKLGRKHADFFTSGDNAERLTEFRQRIMFFGRMSQVYITQLKGALHERKVDDSGMDNKLKTLALATCKNITTLIKDFLHQTPAFRTRVTLSWKCYATPTLPSESVTEKRKRSGITPISLENLRSKREKRLGNAGSSQQKGLHGDNRYSNGKSSSGRNSHNRSGRRKSKSSRSNGRGRQIDNYENFLLR